MKPNTTAEPVTAAAVVAVHRVQVQVIDFYHRKPAAPPRDKRAVQIERQHWFPEPTETPAKA